MLNLISSISINKQTTILLALRKMDEIQRRLLIILQNDQTFYSLLSIGDIQRAIINNKPLDFPVEKILRDDIVVAHAGDDIQLVKQRMKTRRTEFMPVIDEAKQIIDIIFWEDLFEEKKDVTQFNLPVVIMAGGKGTRLKPLTNIIPKPLIPINDKTIIEDIMDRFVEHGCHNFYISVNYKEDMIRYYFSSLRNLNYCIQYIHEDKPLGTGGSLAFLKGKINETFFVSNCDILIDDDYSEILKYHQNNRNEITLVAAIKHFSIPYGTMETTENGILVGLKEKPELTFMVNSGMYIIEPHILQEIPENTFSHITQLIENVLQRGGKVGAFPVSEKSWRDMGSLSELRFKGGL